MTGTPFEAEGRRYLMGIGVDVTERRRAEEALRESEESLAITLQSIGDAVIATDIRGNITRMNDTAERLTGWSLAEAMGRPLQEVFNIMNAETGEPAGNPVERVLASGKTVGLANHTVLISRSGDERQIADSAAPIRDGGGRVSGVVLVFSDVTDKYRMEEALRESEARLSTLFGAMTEMVVLHELLFDERGVPTDYRIIDCNGAFSEIIGIRKEDAVGRPATEVYGQKEAPYLAEFAEVAITGKPLVFSTYYGPLNRHFSISVVSPWKNRFATITTDITDQKRTEMDLNAKVAELRETWELFSLFMDHLPAVVFIKDHEGRTVFTNKAMNDALGSKAWLGRTAAEIFDPETMRRIVEDDRRALELGYQKVQERFPHLDGKLYDYETQKFSIPRAGKPPLLGGIAINVTERNLAEARLREKSAELDRYFASSLDLLCIADLEGRFIRLNPEWEHVLGYSVEELEGKRFLDFVHPDDVESTVNAIGALQERREVLSFENRYRRKDGEYRWIEWRSHPEGNLIYAAARDVTARKLAETELQKQLAEKEILLKEVHHRIKNNIASIEALLTMQVTSVADPEAASALNEAIGRVNSMRILYEKLLMGETYEESSVKDYLESIVESVVALYPDAVRIAVRTRVDEFDLAPKKLFPLGIIVNELLTNVMKYAFVGRSRGSVDLLLKRTGASAVMVMQDDGIGLPADFRKTGTQRFGLMLVSMLGEQLGGRFSIESAGGTRCTLRFEL
jgi:PAS domain S-box-containing protein